MSRTKKTGETRQTLIMTYLDLISKSLAMFPSFDCNCNQKAFKNKKAVARRLASHQCVPGSIPGPGAIFGLSLLFSTLLRGVRRFSLPSKTNISNFQFDLECKGISERAVVNSLMLWGKQITYLHIYIIHQMIPEVLLGSLS